MYAYVVLHRKRGNVSEVSNQSDVARIRRQIDLEAEAIALAMNGPAIVANHAAIDARYRNLGKAKEELALHVGEEEATEAMTESYKRIVG